MTLENCDSLGLAHDWVCYKHFKKRKLGQRAQERNPVTVAARDHASTRSRDSNVIIKALYLCILVSSAEFLLVELNFIKN